MAGEAFASISLVGQLNPFLDQEALVTSHLDYCDYLLMGLVLKTTQKLQSVQNAAAAPLLRQLLRFPVSFQVQFKVPCPLKAALGTGPGCLQDHLFQVREGAAPVSFPQTII